MEIVYRDSTSIIQAMQMQEKEMRTKSTEKEKHKLINLQVIGVGGLNIFSKLK